MLIQINTDRNVEGREDLAFRVEAVVRSVLERFGDRITRVEVHLGDENAHKPGADDKRCVMEARAAGLQPIAVSHHAPAIELAVDGAAEKLVRALDSALGRLGS